MRDKLRDAFVIAADGRSVRFGLGYGAKAPVLFDLAAFRLADVPQTPAGFAPPRTSGLAVSDWEDSTAPKLNGRPIALEDYERSRALAIAPDASRFVLGTEWLLRAYRADGGELWKKAISGIAWGVNISGNGKLVVAAYADGTIRWHRLSDGQELLALFVHAEDRRYIAWTPQGYYAASPGGEDLIGWHVNRGFDTAPDFYPASTFASTFRRPGYRAKPRWIMLTRRRRNRRRRASSIRCGSCFRPPHPCPSPARGEGIPPRRALTLSPGGRGWPQSGRVRGSFAAA